MDSEQAPHQPFYPRGPRAVQRLLYDAFLARPIGLPARKPFRSLDVSRARRSDKLADRRFGLAMKRVLDVAVSLALLILLAPGLLAIAMAIRLTSPGPAIFRQQRYGIGGKKFEIFKFRTMYTCSCDQSGVKQVQPRDARVTPVGRLLRRSSLDELPQLLNVLKGEMSLVGPRPHVPGMLGGGILYEELVPEYFDRLRVLPGVTGLAQVNGLRGSTDDPTAARARISNDLAYIERWSLGLDIKIIIMTARRELFRGNGF